MKKLNDDAINGFKQQIANFNGSNIKPPINQRSKIYMLVRESEKEEPSHSIQ